MKVAIISIFDSENFGNRFQNYAMQKVLHEYASSVVTIKNKYWVDRALSRFTRTSKLAESVILNDLIGRRRKAMFLRFNQKHIDACNACCWANHENHASITPKGYSLYCAGSDQVWNPTIGRTGTLNYLAFAEHDRTFSYAASFGIDHIPEEYVEDVRRGLEHIKYISVREEAGKQIVEELTGRKDVYVHIDPTMLLTAEEWDAVSCKPKHPVPTKYIMTYFLGEVSSERKTAIQNKAKELGCEIVDLMDADGPYYNNGPGEFLYLVKHATMVCTDSFHGSVFSFLYERPFVVFDRAGGGLNMGSRLETLCSKFALRHCIAQGDVLPNIPLHPDYAEGFSALAVERKRSGDYLKMIFQEAERLGLCK